MTALYRFDNSTRYAIFTILYKNELGKNVKCDDIQLFLYQQMSHLIFHFYKHVTSHTSRQPHVESFQTIPLK